MSIEHTPQKIEHSEESAIFSVLWKIIGMHPIYQIVFSLDDSTDVIEKSFTFKQSVSQPQ